MARLAGRVQSVVIHVGLPKTGTTTLQKQVFQRLPNYFGKEQLDSAPVTWRGFAQLREVIQFRPPEWWKTRDALEVRTMLGRVAGELPKLGSRVIISFENMIASEFFGPNKGAYERPDGTRFHPSEHFPEILDALAPERTRTVVLVTCRQQWTWLPSLYAQLSDRIPSASQQHFDHELDKILSADWLDQSTINLLALGTQIVANVRPDSLTFLPVESMGTRDYADALAQTLGVRSKTIERAVSAANFNGRRQAHDSWKLRQFGPGFSRRREILERMPPGHVSESGSDPSPRRLQNPGHISLNALRQQEIRDVFSETNGRVPGDWTPVGLPGYVSPAD
jgi:hypothetical protein